MRLPPGATDGRMITERMIVGRAILAAVGRSYLEAANADACCPWSKAIELGVSGDPATYNAAFARSRPASMSHPRRDDEPSAVTAPAAYWSPAQAAASLVQLAYLERSLAHILAGWAVKMPVFDAKRAFGLQMHRSMERATYLRSRVHGLCHATASEATVPAGLRTVLSHVDRAQTPARLVAAIYRWLYPRLIELYETHLREADPDGDRASIELIRSFLTAAETGTARRPRPSAGDATMTRRGSPRSKSCGTRE